MKKLLLILTIALMSCSQKGDKFIGSKSIPKFVLTKGEYNKHFIVYYLFFKDDSSWGAGNIGIDAVGYPNNKKLVTMLEKINKLKKGSIIVTGIDEISSNDLKNYNLEN